MRCKKARKLISEYIDDSLKAEQKFILEKHLKECAKCYEFFKDLKSIASKAKNLESISPPPNLWPRIETSLKGSDYSEAKELKKALQIFHIPAYKFVLIGVAVFIIAVFLIIRFYSERGEKVFTQNEYILRKFEEAERHYKLAIKSLEEAFSMVKGNMDSEIMENFMMNLKIINSSIEESKKAVLRNPYSIDNRIYLLIAYQNKLNFLREILKMEKFASAEDFNSNL
ncbi:zf-HC2 domain-containing protein [Candidatus Aminicenantes bacterium AC-335-K20]|jgi:tetratricopeptide (TPR) repeat protein|nr:zf-HC2 domain-containing protein [SCandidatus Aminicenantes bacterium Aminicenantia_JdfR_composite]MCP2597488.1 zf-HC2 domain-containing protein [Candidatus Aminicenantes bacterium AC-335-G13]MCP2597900.1 zf-HC2 domain-containing protein [Candidatus Aminicenantes bacterium AC-335-L06]MCP2619449.1 zf-HC2 domain-containing protein [Candidatus Aminicenantes bacterium AC-335-K20]